MRSDRPPLFLTIAAVAGLLFMHLPLLIIFAYAFTTEDKSYAWPPPGLTLKWFAVTWNRPDVWEALSLSLRVAAVSTLIALVLGTLCAAAVARSRFFGREVISLLVILPIALPGIITAWAAYGIFQIFARIFTVSERVFRVFVDPMWLVAMPGTAWWALHRFRLPRARRGTESAGRHRRAGRQARRWTRPATAILRPAA